MKKRIFTLLFCVMIVGLAKATVVFDPATIPADSLKEGMSIVEIDGVKMLKVVINEWSQVFNLPATINVPANENKVRVVSKYDKDTTSFPADNLITLIELKTTGDDVVQLKNDPSSEEFATIVGDATAIAVTKIQIAGQEKTSWSAIKGGIIYIGKIITYEADSKVLFDPAKFEDTLPAGMEIVKEGTDTLLKVVIEEWENFLEIVPFNMGVNNKVQFKAKLDAGTSGFTVAQIKTFVKGIEGKDEAIFEVSEESVASLGDFEGDAKKGKTISKLQFAGQETVGWTAVKGAILYIGKITVYEKADEYEKPRVKYNVIYTGGEEIEFDGIQKEDIWLDADEDTVKQVAIGKETNDPKSADDNSAFWYATYDMENLYVFLDVKDDIVMPLGTSENYWMNDGVEIFVDIKDRRIKEKRINSEQHQLRYNVGRKDADTTALGGFVSKWGGINGTTGYTMEIAVPWKGICKGAVADDDIEDYIAREIKGGKKVAFEISLIDADKLDGRKSILNWGNNTGEDQAYTNSQYYGQLKLGSTSAIKNLKVENQFKMYPNPTTGMVTIEMEDMTSIQVIDLTGRFVQAKPVNSSSESLDVSGLNSGIYLISVESNSGRIVQKLRVR